MADVEVPQFDPTAKKRPKKNYRSKPRLFRHSPFAHFLKQLHHETRNAKTVTAEEQMLLSQFGDKKRPKKVAGADAAGAAAAGAASEGGRVAGYTYEELLTRIFGILAEKNPEHGTRSQPIYIKPPTVGREGKKTVWFNFGEICDQFVSLPFFFYHVFVSHFVSPFCLSRTR